MFAISSRTITLNTQVTNRSLKEQQMQQTSSGEDSRSSSRRLELRAESSIWIRRSFPLSHLTLPVIFARRIRLSRRSSDFRQTSPLREHSCPSAASEWLSSPVRHTVTHLPPSYTKSLLNIIQHTLTQSSPFTHPRSRLPDTPTSLRDFPIHTVVDVS